MKKHICLVLFLFLSSQAFAQLQDPAVPRFLWAESIDGPYRDVAEKIKKDKDNNLFFISSLESKNPDTLIYKDLKNYGSIAPNNNYSFVFYKIKKDGTPLWTIESHYGNFKPDQSAFVPTNDGGAFLLLKGRRQEDDKAELLAEIKDAKGKTSSLYSKRTKYSTYRPILIRLNAEGEILWSRAERLYDEPRNINGSLRYRGNAFSLYDAATDEHKNIYLCGHIEDTLYWTKPDNSIQKIVPHKNVKDWNGSASGITDPIVLKLDSMGKYLWHVNNTSTSESMIEGAFFNSVLYEKGSIYLYGKARGILENEGELLCGGKSINIFKKDVGIFTKISAEDGTADWIHQIKPIYTAEKWTFREITTTSISANNDKLLLTGSFTGGIVYNDKDSLKIQPDLKDPKDLIYLRQMFVLKLDPASGEVEAAQFDHHKSNHSKATNAYLINKKVYVVGDTRGGSRFLFVFDKDLNFLKSYDLITGGGAMGAQTKSAVFINDELYMLALSLSPNNPTEKDPNPPNYFFGTTKSITVRRRGSIIASFKIFDIPSSVPTLQSAADGLRVYTAKGEIIIDAEKATSITIYSISGQIVMRFIAEPGRTVKAIAPGIYIVNRQKVIVL